MSNIKEHLKECIFGNHKCVFAKICKENCNWCGPLLNMKKHVKQMHKAEADTLNTEEPLQMLLAMKSETEFEPVRQILLALEEMFLTMFKVVDGTFYCVVVHIGARANASKYKYTLRMRTGKEALSCSFITASFMDNIEELLKNGECMALRLSCIKKFVKCSKLRMDIEIHEYGAEEEDDDDITEEQDEGDSEEK
ncbi:hypothetical protein C0J52_20419 [Blattella germanica]|nr:hypothetical protein C0J52_20419 [Blattella germanica]